LIERVLITSSAIIITLKLGSLPHVDYHSLGGSKSLPRLVIAAIEVVGLLQIL
jgi:hypothetical protein